MPEFTTTRPTGRAAWPLILLAGIEGSGKTWAAATATSLDLFGRSLFLEVGEQMADEYGAIEGASYEIIRHDGTERQIIQAAKWAAEQPQVDGKPSLLIIDSMTEVWQVMQDEQQRIANERAAKKGRRTDSDATITMDQWNVAKDHFNDVVMAARKFPGPVIMTARLDNVSVVEGGQPTGEKIWKVRSEKNLPYAATVIMQAREPLQWMMTKVASRHLRMPPSGSMKWPDFTIEELLIRLGMDETTDVAESTYVRPKANSADEDGGSQEPERAAPTMSPEETATGELPDDLPAVVKQLEADLNRDELYRLYRIAESQANRGVPRMRSHMARIEGAGKRVAKRLADGEVPANAPSQPVSDESQEEASSPPRSETSASTEKVDDPGASQSDVLVQPNTPTTPSESDAPQAESDPNTEESTGDADPKAEDGASAEESSSPAETDESWAPHGVNADSGQPVDDPASRKETRLRAATIKIIETAHGQKANDWVFEQIGLEIAETSTKRLQKLAGEVA